MAPIPTDSTGTTLGRPINRRRFLRTTAVAGVGVSLQPFGITRRARSTARIGLIGVGARGTSHLRGFLLRSDVVIPAVCDTDATRLAQASDLVEDATGTRPAVYTGHDDAYLELMAEENLDGVVISTPWRWHVPMAVAAMEAGLYVGVEVPAATTLEGCWELVRTAESTGVPCMMLENVCYRRDVMAVLNMVREGLFGELIHCRCGYQHSLMPYLFGEDVSFGPGTGSVSSWRTQHYVDRNGDLYPTHGIGPVAHWLDINRGNRFVQLTSTSTKARGLHDHIVDVGGPNHPNEAVTFQQGDIVTTTLTTARGESILITHDTSLPRPYSLGFQVQGTDGIWTVDNDSIHIEGRSPAHQWEAFTPYQEEYDAALWQRYEQDAEGSGHGGMDFFVRHAFVEAIKRQEAPPMDVYDAAAWSAIGPLSEASIAQGGHPQAFPDFTAGGWMHNPPIFFPDAY